MNNSLRFFLLAGIFLLAVAVGLASISQHFGAEAATVTALLLISIPMAINPPTHILGAAATAARNTEERPGDFVYLPLAAATTIYQGTLVARDASGNLVPASDTAALRVVGRAEETVDNSAGDAGDLSANVGLGTFKFDNSAGDAITAAMICKMAEVEDDQTVASDSTNHVSAGRIVAVDSDGVWVDTRHAFYGPKTVIAITSTDGTAAAASASVGDLAAEAEKIGDDVRALHTSLFG